MTGLGMAIRALHLGSSLTLAGLFAFLLLVARPAFQAGKGDAGSTLERFDARLLRLAGWSLLVMFLTALLAFWVQMATATGRPLLQAISPDAAWSLLATTQYGRVWLIRLALMLLLGAILWLRGREEDGKDWWALRLEVVGLAFCLLVAQAWTGHAATGEGWKLAYQVAADALHLCASGVWLGGLPALLLLLTWAQRTDDPQAEQVAAEATRGFSRLGLVSMGVLLSSGLVNAWELVGTLPALVGTTYGRVLSLKLTLLLPLLAIAALNLLRERPRLQQSAAAPGSRSSWSAMRRLRRNVLGEIILGGMILVLVGALGFLPPAVHEQPTWPFSFRLSWEATKDLPGVRSWTAVGLQLSMIGFFAALLSAIMRFRRWPLVAGVGLLTIAAGFALWLPNLSVDAYPTTYVRPTVPYNALSIANGLQLYADHCALCHGTEGYGDGPAAAGLRPRPADLTAKHTADHTAGDIFWWLSHGIRNTAMPGFQDRLSEEERWDLINVVRILSASEQARALSPSIAADIRVVAPDFFYTTPLGETRALKDFRGLDQVLLVFFSLPESSARLAQLHDLYSQLRPLGTEILAIPLGGDEASDSLAERLSLPFPVVTDGASEAAAAYTMFRRSLNPENSPGNPQQPAHIEFLIDRQGYIRGRWLPSEGEGWAESEQLLEVLAQLRREKLDAPPPDLHVH
jgi:putative copper export protein/mono/diheme cytochrome c family protein/peroxiredoxin